MSSERQSAITLMGVRPDHVGRYFFASKFIKPGFLIMDAMCGTGYGSHILATNCQPSKIVAFDKSPEAMDIFSKHYAHPLIEYRLTDYTLMDYPPDTYDMVICLEAIEHIRLDVDLIASLHTCLKPNGILLLSTPNEDMMPWNPKQFPEHVKHYTPSQLSFLLKYAGFDILSWNCQSDKMSVRVEETHNGKFMIVVARKNGNSH